MSVLDMSNALEEFPFLAWKSGEDVLVTLVVIPVRICVLQVGAGEDGGVGVGGVALRLQEAFLILSFLIVFITKVENTSFLFL